MKPLFNNLAELAHEQAVNRLIGTKLASGTDPNPENLTSFLIIKPNGKWDLIATPWSNDKEKREMILSVCLHILTERATGYCFSSEVWWAHGTKEEAESHQRIGPPPRERPDRQEAFIALLGDGKEREFKAWEIQRDQSGVCTALKAVEEKAMGFESWIADSLDRAIQLTQMPGMTEVVKDLIKKL